jgi:TatD DNase family protein
VRGLCLAQLPECSALCVVFLVIDTHCHLTFKDFAGQVDRVVADAQLAGVRGMITVSTTSQDCHRGLELAQQYEGIWCTAGIHPLHSDEPRDWDAVRRVGEHERCVAWGELGLDYHYSKPPRPLQHEVLAEQLAFLQACADDGLTKPIVVHCRDAFDDLLAIFRSAPFDPSRYVFHCFTATPTEARQVLDFGASISFTGVVTFKNAPEVAEAAKLVPLDRMMVETDSPFLAPVPVRKIWPNEPQYVPHIARFVAELRGIDVTQFEHQLDANAERFFSITLPAAHK